VAESGLPGFDMVSWYGLWGPAALPKELGKRLSGEVAKAVRSQLAVERLGDQGFDAVGSTPEEFAVFLEQELVKYTRIVKQANVKVE
jgi:tripartite-type tricarboxylate transporter receptor subunit TctC